MNARFFHVGTGFGLLILGGVLGFWLHPGARLLPAAPVIAGGDAARGAQLVMLGGCDDCHTPKLASGAPDMTRRFSGYHAGMPLPPALSGVITGNMQLTAWRGPWGLTLSANITPDRKTGIGGWTLPQFIHTLRSGVDPQGRPLRPPMDTALLQQLPRADLADIFAYLQSVQPIVNPVGIARGKPAAVNPGRRRPAGHL